jgi:aspartokinase-like uncharacterized kinase
LSFETGIARLVSHSSTKRDDVHPIVLFKLGGSLLTLPDLGRRVRDVMNEPARIGVPCATLSRTTFGRGPSGRAQPEPPVTPASLPRHRPLLVVGGGPAADLVREWDRIHHLGDDLAHRLAISAMSSTALLAASLVDRARLVSRTDELPAVWERGELPVSLVEPLLTELEAHSRDRLPDSWDVTSDSIAAWLAIQLQADELVLLKSVDLPPAGLEAAAREGLVDSYFPRLAGRLPRVTWIDLRAADRAAPSAGPLQPL